MSLSQYSSLSGDLLPNMQGIQIHQLLNLAKQSLSLRSEDKALEDKLITPHPVESELQNLPLQHLMQMAKVILQRASNSSLQMSTPTEDVKRTPKTVAFDSEVQTDLPLSATGSITQARGSQHGDMLQGVWKEVVEMLQKHSSEIAHDMKNPLNGVLALSQNVVAGVFGELPQVAVDQLNVVRSCAYHLLNMINMTRDMLKVRKNWPLTYRRGEEARDLKASDEVLNRTSAFAVLRRCWLVGMRRPVST